MEKKEKPRINALIVILIALSILLYNCNSVPKKDKSNHITLVSAKKNNSINLLTDINPLGEEDAIKVVIEIPAGTIDKWELNKSTGKLEWESVNNSPRIINYIGYPGNYGMIPRTLVPKDKGGDGDPLDILVLGPPVKRSQVITCKIIGVLYLLDRGEEDNKLLAVSEPSSMSHLNSIEELDAEYNGVSQIIKLWFENYKGPGVMLSKGYGNKNVAMNILMDAINEYQLQDFKQN